ncbi:MLP-like protein 28 [Striga asiatica]|uniref:MLP-like protein 28 n=1 Tax=Striga asiatica TaxID=4170 RepID=A0A5A7PD80_STRAF|nr:MLP-like protein 28 [Striga asiatica]
MTVTERIEAIYDAKKTVTFAVIGGDLLGQYKSFFFTLNASEGMGTWTFAFEKLEILTPPLEPYIPLAITTCTLVSKKIKNFRPLILDNTYDREVSDDNHGSEDEPNSPETENSVARPTRETKNLSKAEDNNAANRSANDDVNAINDDTYVELAEEKQLVQDGTLNLDTNQLPKTARNVLEEMPQRKSSPLDKQKGNKSKTQATKPIRGKDKQKAPSVENHPISKGVETKAPKETEAPMQTTIPETSTKGHQTSKAALETKSYTSKGINTTPESSSNEQPTSSKMEEGKEDLEEASNLERLNQEKAEGDDKECEIEEDMELEPTNQLNMEEPPFQLVAKKNKNLKQGGGPIQCV